jgi:hypothetical protein
MKKWTLDELKALSVQDLQRLYIRACEMAGEGNVEAIALKQRIENCERPYTNESNVSYSDETAITMANIIWRDESRAAMLDATKRGEPALAGIEATLQAELGDAYRAQNYGTVVAGKLVGERMRQLGYVNGGKANMPPGSVAQTAETWRLRSMET